MRKLLFATILTVALATGMQTHPAHADPSTEYWNVEFCDSFTAGDAADTCVIGAGATANANNPTYVTRLAAQTGFGPSAEPLLDFELWQWTPNLVVSPVPTSSIIGEVSLEFKTGVAGPLAPSNIDPATGAPPACDEAGTSIASTFPAPIVAGVITSLAPVMTPAAFNFALFVQSFDDDDNDLHEYTAGYDANDGGDTLPETQGDDNGNGVPDGADRTSDAVARAVAQAGAASAVVQRGYAVLPIVPGVWQLDVHHVTLNLGSGYVTAVLRQDAGVPLSFQAAGLQTYMICPRFEAVTATFGRAHDNPATAADEGHGYPGSAPANADNDGVANRTLNSALGGATLYYQAGISTDEDYDSDGLPQTLDRCQLDPAAGTVDPGIDDGDMVTGTCDNRANSPDNCDGGGPAPACGVALGAPDLARCVGPEAVGFEGGSAGTAYPWDLDQDVDCDGAANFADNCPRAYNADQRDEDFDGAGDACDTNVDPNGCGPAGIIPLGYEPCFIATGHDHDHLCEDIVTIGGVGESDFDAFTCYSFDADGDGIQDYEPAITPAHRDVNSDSDYDGCSDGAEAQAGATGGTQFCEGNPLDADTDNDGTLDGNENTDGNGLVDWRDDVVNNSTTSLSPNNNGSPDSDRDGCTNREENGLSSGLGGNRDALNPYDFADVPAPLQTASPPSSTNAGSVRNRVISLADVGAALAYVGRTSVHALYQADLNLDGIKDGLQFDRTAAGPPNGAISLNDVGVVLGQVGTSCAAAP
jgi:hypothetical protein